MATIDWRAIQKHCTRLEDLFKGFQDIAAAAETFGHAEGELDRLTTERNRVTTEIGQQRQTLEAIVAQIPQSQHTLDTLRGQIEGADVRVRATTAKADEAERRGREASAAAADQQAQADVKLTAARQALAQVQVQHRDLSAEVVRLTSIRDQLKKSLAAV